MELFKLFGRILVENGDANRALNETDKLAVGATNGLGGYLDKLKGWAVAAGAAFTASAIGKGLKEVWDMSSQVADIGDNIDKASQKFLLSREAYQEWAYVAERSGFSMESLGNSVVKLAKNVGSGSEDVMAALEEIGISASWAMTAEPEELFAAVVEGLQNVEDVKRRSYLGDKLMAEGSKEIAPLLNMNKEETQELIEGYHKLGGMMSKELVDASAAYKDALTDLQEAAKGLKNELAEETLPAMTQTVNGLTEMLTGDFSKGLQDAAEGINLFLQGVLTGFGRFAVGMVKAAIGGVKDLVSGAKEFVDELLNPTTDVSEEMGAFLGSGKPFDAGDSDLIPQLIDLRKQYLAAGGSEWAFMAETTEKYGAEVADQLIAALEESGGEVETATGAFTQAAQDAAKTWGEGTAKVSKANDAVVAAMQEAAAGYAGLRPGQGLGGFGGNLADRFSHALGIPFVPRDEYPAKLHYGERVLTRQENQEYSDGKASGPVVNHIHIYSVAQSPAQEAAAITAALQRARWRT